ncbi:NAD(P)H-dependent oxidoreductase [Plantactinospora sp. GCM10030261]|uniref:NAD(P)H-dependent oxidoreductase n=1 Tax=Plantactinospora sp. GCM10030261 TaxID=3273420 RepID=UPI0036190C38
MTHELPPQRKKILLVTAHPEARSLTTALAAFAADELRATGHEVRVSDLYAMKWKATVDADDFPDHPADRRLEVLPVSGEATLAGRLSPDIAAEQEKLRWADAVILQFPMWWFSMPAILKGWIDRVFTMQFAHGPAVPPPYHENSPLAGRRALLAVTIGARESAFSDRGIHGYLPDLLFPIQHGVLWFTGMATLEPFAVHNSLTLSAEGFTVAKDAYRRRLDGLFTDEPVPYRSLVGGDYDREMRLLPGLERPGTSGLGLHLRRPS